MALKTIDFIDVSKSSRLSPQEPDYCVKKYIIERGMSDADPRACPPVELLSLQADCCPIKLHGLSMKKII